VLLKGQVANNHEQAKKLAGSFGWLEMGKDGLKSNRERREMEAKLKDLNLIVPW